MESKAAALVKETGITNAHAKCTKEYSCMEEANMKFRPYMEDSNLIKSLRIEYCCIDQFGGFSKQGYFGVFDGHGGKEISEYCANRMHEVTKIHII